jgi:adenylylsulfate kinase
MIRVLVITGSMGAGKTTVMAEASDLLTASDIVHAAIDLDALGIRHAPDATAHHIEYRNLVAVWRNYADAGITRLLIAEAIERREELELLQQAIPGSQLLICRLTASVETMQQRVRTREPGALQEAFVARVTELEALLDEAKVEDFSLDNSDRAVTDVAREMLVRAGWL